VQAVIRDYWHFRQGDRDTAAEAGQAPAEAG